MLTFKHKLMDQAGADGGAGAGGAAGGNAGGAAGGQQGNAGGQQGGGSPWYGGFQDTELRGYAELKGWKEPSEVVNSYRNLEKLHGVPAEQLLKLPKDDTDKDGWNKVYDRLGRPAKAEDYKLPTLPGDNGEFAKVISAAMYEAGIPAKAAQHIAKVNNEFIQKAMAGAQQVRTEKFAQEHTALMKEWGEAADKNSQVVDGVAQQLGIDEKALTALRDVMGPAGAMKFLYNIGAKLGEDRFVTGGSQGFNGALSPAAAQARIAQLRQDKEFANKYLNGDAAAKDELERLHKMAYPQ